MERVGKSAVYFKSELVRVFGDSLRSAAKVRTDNKKASQRVKDTVADLRQKLDMHVLLLGRIAEEGFSMSSYLRFKQVASLDAGRESSLKRVAKGGRLDRSSAGKPGGMPTSATRQPREKKPVSHQVSFEMMQKGMTREEIATARGLVVSTITGHLMQHVETGDISLDDLFTPVVVNAVKSVLDIVGTDAGFMELREKLPSGISDLDLRSIASALRKGIK